MFPEGRGDKRFCINYDHFLTPDRRLTTVLQYETKVSGRVKAEWMLPLDVVAESDLEVFPKNIRNQGTIVRMLFYMGYKLRGPVKAEIATLLRQVGGYACYQQFGRPYPFNFAFWFVGEDGIPRGNGSITYEDIVRKTGSQNGVTYPDIGIPYPVTKIERELLRVH